jgi:hypothetical protein
LHFRLDGLLHIELTADFVVLALDRPVHVYVAADYDYINCVEDCEGNFLHQSDLTRLKNVVNNHSHDNVDQDNESQNCM